MKNTEYVGNVLSSRVVEVLATLQERAPKNYQFDASPCGGLAGLHAIEVSRVVDRLVKFPCKRGCRMDVVWAARYFIAGYMAALRSSHV